MIDMTQHVAKLIKSNPKNVRGWRTERKPVVFSVDDYANVRLDSVGSLERLEQAGLPPASRFDQFDAVEARDDLNALFEPWNP